MARSASKSRSGQKGNKPTYARVILKLTGESFAGVDATGIVESHLDALADKITSAARTTAQIAIVIGAGNFIRGADLAHSKLISPTAAHQMGMTATLINGLALTDALQAKGCSAVLTSATPTGNLAEHYSPRRAIDHLQAGRIVVLAGGTGNAFVTTDSAAAIRAAELGADALLKATKVDGVYSDDPAKSPTARRYTKLTYSQVIDDRLGVMDLAATEICQRCDIPIIVFDFQARDSIARALTAKLRSTMICKSVRR